MWLYRCVRMLPWRSQVMHRLSTARMAEHPSYIFIVQREFFFWKSRLKEKIKEKKENQSAESYSLYAIRKQYNIVRLFPYCYVIIRYILHTQIGGRDPLLLVLQMAFRSCRRHNGDAVIAVTSFFFRPWWLLRHTAAATVGLDLHKITHTNTESYQSYHFIRLTMTPYCIYSLTSSLPAAAGFSLITNVSTQQKSHVTSRLQSGSWWASSYL